MRLTRLRWIVILAAAISTACLHEEDAQAPPAADTAAPEVASEAPVLESDLITTTDPRPARPDDWFEDVTDQSGVSFRQHSGRQAGAFTMVEAFGSGVALFDYDGDGDVDLFCLGGGDIDADLTFHGAPCRLFRNDGAFQFTDVTDQVGLNVDIDYSHGVTVGDVNSDGLADLFVTCFGTSRLFVNRGGERFEDATDRMNLDVVGWHTAACIADVTSDGIADLFVAGYLQWQPSPTEFCRDPKSGLRDVCMPGNFDGAQDRLFVGTAEGLFVDATAQAGLLPDGKGLGVIATDFDGNGHIDLYVANDVIRNHLYLGQGGGRFVETAIAAGVAGNEFGAAEGSMGVDAGDFNGDGLLDIVVTNYEFEENDLYRNEGQGLFSHVTIPAGLGGAVKPYVGFGTLFLDADMDGWQDLLVVNGHVTYRNRQSPFQQPAFLFRNESGTRFRDVTDQAGPWFSVPHSGRGAAVGDINNDGAADLVVSEMDGPVSILRNRRPPEHWIGVRLTGTDSGTDAVGARARIVSPSESLPQSIVGGRSYLSYCDPRLLFPITDPQQNQCAIQVQWPSGLVEVFVSLATDQYHELKEAAGQPVEEATNGAEGAS